MDFFKYKNLNNPKTELEFEKSLQWLLEKMRKLQPANLKNVKGDMV